MRISRMIPALAATALAVLGLAPTAAATTTAQPPAAVGAPAAAPGAASVQPIIGGGYASDAPWAARLFSNGRQTCSASIIAPTWILTAKHCVGGGGLSFRIGSLDQTSGGTVANGVSVHNHPPRTSPWSGWTARWRAPTPASASRARWR